MMVNCKILDGVGYQFVLVSVKLLYPLFFSFSFLEWRQFFGILLYVFFFRGKQDQLQQHITKDPTRDIRTTLVLIYLVEVVAFLCYKGRGNRRTSLLP